MPVTEVVIAAGISALIQLIQGGFTLARMSGLSVEQIQTLFDEQLALFKQKSANSLPDA